MTLKLLIILDVGIHFINEARALVARPRSMCRNASLARSRRLYDKLDLESCIFSVASIFLLLFKCDVQSRA